MQFGIHPLDWPGEARRCNKVLMFDFNDVLCTLVLSFVSNVSIAEGKLYIVG